VTTDICYLTTVVDAASAVVAVLRATQLTCSMQLPLLRAERMQQTATAALSSALATPPTVRPAPPVKKGTNGHSTPLAAMTRPSPRVAIEISAWDPDHYDPVETSKCRALLLEVIRRAAHDWVLYRLSRKQPQQSIAQEAYVWLFEEGPGHPWWKERIKNKLHLLSFLSICSELDLDPEVVRRVLRRLTVKGVMSSGRPAERRRRRTEVSEDVDCVDHSLLVDIDIHTVGDDPDANYYESYYTPRNLSCL
jgi:hypothetical protein